MLPCQRSEPRAFALARIGVVVVLALSLIAVAALSLERYITAPILLRESKISAAFAPVPLLLNVHAFTSEERITVVCDRQTREPSTTTVASTTLALVANATSGRDYVMDNYLEPPMFPAISYLTNVSHPSMATPWRPFRRDAVHDVMLQCYVNVTSVDPIARPFVGELYYENMSPEKVVPGRVPTFSALEATMFLPTNQLLNLVLGVTRYCYINNTCEWRRDAVFSQSVNLPGAAANTRTELQVRYSNEPSDTAGQFMVTQFTEERSHTLLEAVSNVLSAWSFIVFTYAWLMGQSRLDTLGVVQRYILKDTTRAYVDEVKQTPDEDGQALNEHEALRNVLYTFYLAPPHGELRWRGSRKRAASVQEAPLETLTQVHTPSPLPSNKPPVDPGGFRIPSPYQSVEPEPVVPSWPITPIDPPQPWVSGTMRSSSSRASSCSDRR